MNAENIFSSWENAVAWLRTQLDQSQLVADCYYDDPLIEAADLQIGAAQAGVRHGNELNLDSIEMDHIRRVLASVEGNKSRAAKILGINRRTLYRKGVQ